MKTVGPPEEALALVVLEMRQTHPTASMNHDLGRAILTAATDTDPVTYCQAAYHRVGAVQPQDVAYLDKFSMSLTMAEVAREESSAPDEITTGMVAAGIKRIGGALGSRTTRQAIRIATELRLLPTGGLWSGDNELLTPTEAILLGLLSRGWTASEIANRFELNRKTLDQYANDINGKLGSSPHGSIRVAFASGALMPDYELVGIRRPATPKLKT